MAGQGKYEHDAPLHLHAVVESGEGGRADIAARPGLADAPCQPPHLGSLDAGDLLGLLRGIIFELNLQAFENRVTFTVPSRVLTSNTPSSAGSRSPSFKLRLGASTTLFSMVSKT